MQAAPGGKDRAARLRLLLSNITLLKIYALAR